MSRKPIRHIALGGTIGFSQTAGGAVPLLDVREMVNGVIGGVGPVESVELADMSSSGLRDHHLLAAAELVERAGAEGRASVLVTHGTDTLEETAYFLAMTCRRNGAQVVLTGAMRYDGSLDSDGLGNLEAALSVAGSDVVRGVGPVVVMHDEIHSARFVVKHHATRLNAFHSPAAGPIGAIVEGKPALWFHPSYDDFLAPLEARALPRVEIVPMSIGVGPEVFEAVLATGPDGIVIDGLGAGHVPPELLDVVTAACAGGVPVVASSRCESAGTFAATYGVPGGELDLQRRGVVMAGAISTVKARLRLAVALSAGIGVRDAFPVQ